MLGDTVFFLFCFVVEIGSENLETSMSSFDVLIIKMLRDPLFIFITVIKYLKRAVVLITKQ